MAIAFDRMTRTPNTLDGHRFLGLAGRLQDAVVERLFLGYFEEGLDLNDGQVLVRLAAEAGLPVTNAERLLAGDEGRADVLHEAAQ
jgi:predicted DsbA family dithiol-disulfide isomerase